MTRRLRMRRPILTLVFASMTFALTLLLGILSNKAAEINLFAFFNSQPTVAMTAQRLNLTAAVEATVAKTGVWSYCDYSLPDAPTYSVELEQANVDTSIEPGSVFAVDMVFKNTGNTRLFSADSDCVGMPVLNVGTANQQDRDSIFGSGNLAISGWSAANRVQMTDAYADPDSNFHVIFQSIAPEGDNIYREFFQPVVEGQEWLGDPFAVDISVGTPTEQMKSDISFVNGASLAASSLSGLERNIQVTLATQTMDVRFGDTTVWSLTVSSGSYKTPTPRGTYKILSKEELRVGGESPHYRMPYFQLWDSRGYGIHALPYLGSDGGAFWSEALTHIGIPVSHGCIRTLPDDALALYNFTDIGTPVVVK